MMWKCDLCGYVHEGDEPPDSCPVCGAGADLFTRFEVTAPRPPRRWVCTVCGRVHVGDAPPPTCPVCGVGGDLFIPENEPMPAVAPAPPGRIVVLGAGIAGVTAAERARALAPAATITLVGREPGLPYYRLNLTRLLAGEITAAALPLHDLRWYAEHRIELLCDEAVGLDRERRELRLQGRGLLAYDRLVLATGAHAFVPPIPGVARAGVLTLRTLADAEALLALAGSARRCVCVGGGLLGLEAAGALARRGLEVTVVEGFTHLLPRQLPAVAGRLLEEQVTARGVRVRTGVRVAAIADGLRPTVQLAGGEEIEADLVVLSAGVRPATHLARAAGLEIGKSGLLVDDRLRTSDPAILAAGDLAEHRGAVPGIWPIAHAHGVVAGSNAAGGDLELAPMAPSNRLKVLGIELFSVGLVEPADGSYQIEDSSAPGRYRRLLWRDGRLVGAVLLGDTAEATRLKERVDSSSLPLKE